MFSYRHAFHAGNHADVFKHIVYVALLRYLTQKDAALMVIDTHAGAGAYALDGNYAQTSQESRTGISRLWERKDAPPLIKDYLAIVRAFNRPAQLTRYPGSPEVARAILRPTDKLRLFEMHPTDFRLLDKHFAPVTKAAARVKPLLIAREDGFHALSALLPPPSRRALVMMDPPYELKEDYAKVTEALKAALLRFAGGTYAVWYPILSRIESRRLPGRLAALPVKESLHVTLSVGEATRDNGLQSSGMWILNPPYTLAQTLRETLPWLVAALAQDDSARFTMEEQHA